jgi:hypothetical protein
MSIRGHRRRFVFLAALLLAAGPTAQAEEEQIYKWIDENGQVHFTATPPPRNARPIAAKPQEKRPVQVVPMPASPQPRSIAPSLVRPKEPARDLRVQSPKQKTSERINCGRYEGPLERVRRAQREVNSLESKIERLENDIVSSSSTSCTERAERLGQCREGYFDRDQSLQEARAKLDAAEDELADAEADVRAAEVPRECLNKD